MSKRPRVVSGPGTHGTYTQEVSGAGAGREREPKSVSAQFDEFRKRHIKQNKEIIAANVTGNIAMAAVQAEVFALRSEILQVRQRNIALSRELRKRSRAQIPPKGLDSSQRMAIETILAAVPALQQLLSSSLNVSPPTPQSDPDWLTEDPLNIATPPICQMPLIFTSRPAAIAEATKNRGLGPLTEGSECGSEADLEDLEERKRAISTKLKTIGIEPNGSRPPSPPPKIPKSLPSALISAAQSPLLSSPTTKASPRLSRGGQKSRKRRESGLLTPLVPPIPVEHPKGRINGDAEGTARDEEAVLDLIGNDVKEERISQNSQRQDGRGKDRSPIKRSQQGSGGEGSGSGKIERVGLDVGEIGRSSRSVSEEIGEDGEGGNGGRGRRSRNSVVSYKEPSLNKKMRKPDGTTVDDALKGAAANINPNHGGAGHAGSLSSSTSTLPAHDDLPETISSKAGLLPATHISPISNTAMRRKSILPRPGNKHSLNVDNTPEIEDSSEPPERVIRRSRSNPAFNVIAESSIHPPARSSPRKSNHKPQLPPNRPSQLSSTPIDPRRSVSSTSSGKDVGSHADIGGMQSVKQRDPLIDRNDNGRKGDNLTGGGQIG